MWLLRKFRRKPITHQELEVYLREPGRHYHWDPDISPEDMEKARLALVETLRRAKEMFPRTGHVYIGQTDGALHDFSGEYLSRMFELQQDLMKRQWNSACGDLSGVLHLFHIEDSRILHSIITLLEEYVVSPTAQASRNS